MTTTPPVPADEAKAATRTRKGRSNSDVAFAVPKGLSVSASDAYYGDDSSESQHPSQWGGKGAELLGLNKSACSEPNMNSKPRLDGGQHDPHRHVHVLSHELVQTLSNPSPEAIALAEIALAFCKECCGWKNAHSINDWGYPYISESVTKKLAKTKIPPYERQFHYTHLDKVMAAVRVWLKPDGIIPTHHAGIFVNVIPKLFDKYFFGELDDRGLCRELMAACVAANRRQ